MITLSNLQAKEVVLLHVGERIGFIDDVEIDIQTGQITAIVVQGSPFKNSLLFQRQEVIVIPWERIDTIGTDFILIKDENKTSDIKVDKNDGI